MMSDFDPVTMTKPGDAEDEEVEKKFVKAVDAETDDRFGSPWSPETMLKLAFRTGMSWARYRQRREANIVLPEEQG